MAAVGVSGCGRRALERDDLLPLPPGVQLLAESGEQCGNGRVSECSYQFIVRVHGVHGVDAVTAVARHLEQRGWRLVRVNGILEACRDEERDDCVSVEPFAVGWTRYPRSVADTATWRMPLPGSAPGPAVLVSFSTWGSDL
jgi:hypothetical protein